MSIQAWEYKVIHRARNVQGGGAAGQWDSGVVGQLPELGEEGWELVSVVPRSSVGGSTVAGTTSDEMWIFKRPKTLLQAGATVTVAQVTTPEISATPVEAFAGQRESTD
jgi:hypothetical protein